ncbi:hypothetical protein J2X72_004404 [Phyllobacterium sp. 1468]|nr:hypothetical protein [Phyllobacterium sp. 1468]
MERDGANKNLRVVTGTDDIFIRFSPETLHSRQILKNEAALVGALVQAYLVANPFISTTYAESVGLVQNRALAAFA